MLLLMPSNVSDTFKHLFHVRCRVYLTMHMVASPQAQVLGDLANAGWNSSAGDASACQNDSRRC